LGSRASVLRQPENTSSRDGLSVICQSESTGDRLLAKPVQRAVYFKSRDLRENAERNGRRGEFIKRIRVLREVHREGAELHVRVCTHSSSTAQARVNPTEAGRG
jgi:hypothetical protein